MDETKLCLDILKAALPKDVTVTSEIPFDRPDGPIVQVSRTGGKREAFLDRPVMQILAWHASQPEANALCLDATAAIRDAAMEHPSLSAAEVTDFARDSWAEGGESRYRAQMKLTINL